MIYFNVDGEKKSRKNYILVAGVIFSVNSMACALESRRLELRWKLITDFKS
jgi:hypothetical protein